MLKKLMTGAAIGAAVLAMGVPAHAATKTKLSANFGGNGIVTFTQHGYQWTAGAQVTVPAGNHYVLSFTSEETLNGGVVGSATTDVCTFNMKPGAQVGGCSAKG